MAALMHSCNPVISKWILFLFYSLSAAAVATFDLLINIMLCFFFLLLLFKALTPVDSFQVRAAGSDILCSEGTSG